MTEPSTPHIPAGTGPPPMPLAQLAYAAELARIHALRAAHTAGREIPPGTGPVLRDLSPLRR
jgi:hypothetical protein